MKTDTNYPPTAAGAPGSSVSAGEAVSPNIHSAAEQPHTSSESLSPRAQGTPLNTEAWTNFPADTHKHVHKGEARAGSACTPPLSPDLRGQPGPHRIPG